MTTNEQNEIFQLVKSIGFGLGQIKRHDNPKYILLAYEDEKLSLYMYLNPSSEEIRGLQVALPLPNEIGPLKTEFTPFSFTTQGNNTTLVYSFGQGNIFLRPGRWIQYLLKLQASMQEAMEKQARLNLTPIDDSSLFPE